LKFKQKTTTHGNNTAPILQQLCNNTATTLQHTREEVYSLSKGVKQLEIQLKSFFNVWVSHLYERERERERKRKRKRERERERARVRERAREREREKKRNRGRERECVCVCV